MAELNLDPSSDYVICELGSNSFNLLYAQISSQGLRVKHQLRHVVYLIEGTDDNGIGPQALRRAADALLDFHKWLKQAQLSCHRVVATSAVRNAPNHAAIAQLVRRHLRAPLEILSGQEEASLIYRGVWSELQGRASSGPHLVIDVGGGSTELIWGYQGCIRRQLSIELGSLRLGELGAGVLCPEAHYQALRSQCIVRLKALNLAPMKGRVYVSDGLPKYFLKLLSAPNAAPAVLQYASFMELRRCLTRNTVSALWERYHIQPEIGRLLLPGLAIFEALMSLMAIPKLELCVSALKQGVLAEWAHDCLVLS